MPASSGMTPSWPRLKFTPLSWRRMPVGLALVVVQHVAEVAGVRVPGMFLQGVAPERDVLLVARHVLVRAQHARHLRQHARRADEVRVDDRGGGARRELLLVHEDLRRVIVPAGVVEVTPGLEQAGLEGAGVGAAQPAGEEEVILPEPRDRSIRAARAIGSGSRVRGRGNVASAGGCRAG